METDDAEGQVGTRHLCDALHHRAVFWARLLLQDTDMIGIQQKPYGPWSSAGRSDWRIARPRARTSSKAGSSFMEPITRSNQSGAGLRAFIASSSSDTASSNALSRYSRVLSSIEDSPVGYSLCWAVSVCGTTARPKVDCPAARPRRCDFSPLPHVYCAVNA